MRSAGALCFLLCASFAPIFNAFRKKGETLDNPSITQLRFQLPPEALSASLLEYNEGPCGADTPSPYWTGKPRSKTNLQHSGLLNIPSGDAGWDRELNVLLKEPAIKETWSSAMEVWNCAATNVATKAKAILSNPVPGLGGATFQAVFDTLHKAGCPVWILGGSIRDLISGKKPKDIDTSALCEVPVIERTMRKNKWKVYTNKYQYYEIGTRGAEDGMEGKEIQTLYTHSSIVDWTANMLLLDPIRMYVIDPSGRGISDAKKFQLVPATPKPLDWPAFNLWKAQETQPRYYRYLKFRLRGWQAFEDCFRYFMADEIVKAIEKEAIEEDPHSQMPMWKFLAEQLEDDAKRSTVQKNLLYTFEEDITRGYFERKALAGECGADNDYASTLSNRARKDMSGLRYFKQTLVDSCKDPPTSWKAIAKRKRINLREACESIYDFYQWARGGAYHTFNKGDPVFFKNRKGELLDGYVDAVYKTKKQIDWGYDIVTKQGEKIQAKATAKRVLQRKEESDD